MAPEAQVLIVDPWLCRLRWSRAEFAYYVEFESSDPDRLRSELLAGSELSR